jgi:multiple antibiotic resistance protein
MNIASTALTLFLVLDPFGNMVMFHTLLARVPPERRTRVLIRELVIAFVILLFFLFAGSLILSTLGIRPPTLSISGGILLFLIALGMVFPAKSILQDADTAEPFIVPLAVPMLVGPSAIALLLLLTSKYPGAQVSSALAVLIAWSGSAAVLLVAPWFLRLLGSKGTQAMERLMGLMLILIAVQMFLDGLFSGDFLSLHPASPILPP